VFARIEGLSHAQIAERLGISEANSRKMLSRALVRLANFMQA
jgi:DNA-directed RNA polymerase specialized sigma24 family protein